MRTLASNKKLVGFTKTHAYVGAAGSSNLTAVRPTVEDNDVSSGTNVGSISLDTVGQLDDLLIAVVSNKAQEPTTPSGWTVAVPKFSHTIQTNADVTVYYKYHTGGSEPASHTFALASGTADMVGALIAVRNAQNPLVDAIDYGTKNDGNSSTATFPQVDSSTDDSLCLRFHVDFGSQNTTAPPASHTLVASTQASAGSMGLDVYEINVEDELLASTTTTKAGSGEFFSISIAIGPALIPPSGPSGLDAGTIRKSHISARRAYVTLLSPVDSGTDGARRLHIRTFSDPGV